MTDLAANPKIKQLSIIAAFLIGAGVPLMMFGRAVMQADLGLALIATLALAFMIPGTFARAAHVGDPLFRILLGLTIVMWLPGMFESVDWFRSFKAWSRTFVFIAAAAVMWSILHNDANSRTIALKTLITITLIMGIISCISLLAWPDLIRTLRNLEDHATRPDLWLKSFAASCMCLIPVIIWAGLRLGKYWKWAANIAAILCFVVIFETSNRAAIAGLMAMIIIGAILLGLREKRTRFPLLLGAPILMGLMFFWLFNYGPTFLNHPDAYLPTTLVDPHRQMIWKFTVERAMDAMWFGHGIDTINFQPGAGFKGPTAPPPLIPSHPHNWLVEVFAETGILGTCAVLATLFKLFIGLARSVLANRDTSINFALLALSAGFWGSALFNFSIWSTWWLLTYFVLYAVVASHRKVTAPV
ncbi:MAG: O-antigen ligase family protein [Magnetovibrio sp.]|nr:O-antigen ligase family protein [Magnetovibrio sp.]